MSTNEPHAPLTVDRAEHFLSLNGYSVANRHPAVKVGFVGKFMVYDAQDDEDGFCIVGDDRDQLVIEAATHLMATVEGEGVDDVELSAEDDDIAHEPIGKIEREEGYDQYVLVKRKSGEPLTTSFARRWLMARVRYGSDVPGRWFCDHVSIVRIPNKEESVIGVVHHRLDV